MALAYPMPSYGRREILKEKSRFNSAPLPDIRYLRRTYKPLDDTEFLQIRRNAKKSFKLELDHCNRSATCYGGMHAEKLLDEPTKTRVRPTSGSRKNNPHPPEVFLVNRLRHVPGYYEPEKAKEVEKTCSKEVDENPFKQASSKRPHTAHTTVRQREDMQKLLGQVPAQATEAWLKLCSEKDRLAIRQTLTTPSPRLKSPMSNKEEVTQKPIRGRLGYLQSRSNTEYEKTSKWLQKSGYSKNQSLQHLSLSMKNAQPLWINTLTASKMKTTNKSSAFNEANQNQRFMDFQIHPQWHMAWHKQYDNGAPRHPPRIYA